MPEPPTTSASRKPPHLLWWSIGCVLLSFAVDATVNRYGSGWPAGLILCFWLVSLVPFVIWAILHEKSLLSRTWLMTKLRNHPVSMPMIFLLFLWIAVNQIERIAVHFQSANIPRLRAGSFPSRQSIPATTVTSSSNLPITKRKAVVPAANPPVTKSLSGEIRGSDNTVVGDDRRPIAGNGNTIIGATDAHGNTILNQGGMAIGRGANADPTSIAIGADAHAGTQQNYESQTCVGSACAQGPGSRATFNQFGPPKLEMTSVQRAAISVAMEQYAGTTIRVLTSTNDQDAKQFGAQLVGALQDAHMSVTHKEAGTMVVEGAKPSGISMNFSQDHRPAAIALEREISKLGIAPAMTVDQLPRDSDKSFLVVIVQPTR